MNKKLIIILLSLLGLACNMGFSQEQNTFEFDEKECFDSFPDGVYKDETALFVKKTSDNTTSNTNEFLRDCFLYGIKDGVAEYFVGRDRPLSIEIRGNEKGSYTVDISYSYLKKYYHIPVNALCDIINPTFSIYCIKDKESVKHYYNSYNIYGILARNKPKQVIDNWNVYKSNDGMRIYIHMVNYKYRYEVTWIIDGEKYVGRMIDKLE